jgi:hypothetical protein
MDSGHDFVTTKSWFTADTRAYIRSDDGFNGPYIASGYLFPQALATTDMFNIPAMDINLYGNQAIAKKAPTAPQASLAVGISELAREGFPRLIGSALSGALRDRASVFRSLGSEYLNVEFGWKPFIRDIESTVRSLSRMSETIAQLNRDSGRIVRRRMSWPALVETSSREAHFSERGSNIGTNSSNIINTPRWYKDYNVQHGTTTITDRISQKYWFSGAFTYYLTPGSTWVERVQRYEQYANALLGTRVNPHVLWSLAPWSWLVDWHYDVSSALQASSQLQKDGLVVRWGYLMRTYTHQRTASVTGNMLADGRYSNHSASFTVVRKERRQATPFGFGSQPSGYTDRQWAILAALGMTRAPKTLP